MKKKEKEKKKKLIQDKVEYKHSDVCRITRLNHNIALSFYQLDYQYLTDRISFEGGSIESVGLNEMISTSKIVMDFPAFLQLHEEINILHEKLNKQGFFNNIERVAQSKKSED